MNIITPRPTALRTSFGNAIKTAAMSRVLRSGRFLIVLVLSALMMMSEVVSAQTSQTITTSGTWTVPAGVTSATFYIWGGGGGGGGYGLTSTYFANGGGGGGSACGYITVPVYPGDVYTATIGAGGAAGTSGTANGAQGGTTTFTRTTAQTGSTGTAGPWTVAGGFGGTSSAGAVSTGYAGGAGGTAANVTGTGISTYAGGNGSEGYDGTSNTASTANQGWGGGAGGSGAAGSGAATTSTLVGCLTGPAYYAGGTGTYPGGNGGLATGCGTTSNVAGGTGSAPGGGGSGSWVYSTSKKGGPGGAGQVTIVYTLPASIVLSSANPSVAAGSPKAGSTNNVIGAFQLAVTTAAATLKGFSVQTTGSYTTADVTNLKLWYYTTSTFSAATATLLSTISSPTAAGTMAFPAFSQTIASGTTGYFFVTADLQCAATVGHTIATNAAATANLTFTVTPTSLTNSTSYASGTQTIAASTGSPTITLGANPTTCSSTSAQTVNLPYTATTNTPTLYSISGWSGGSFATVTNAALPATPIVITVPAGTTAGTYTASLSVSTAGGCVSPTYTISVTVTASPAITSNPANASVNAFQSASTSFTVATSTASPTYQWQYSTTGTSGWANVATGTPAGVTYTGATSATLGVATTNATPVGSAYYYQCVVTAGGCSSTTTAAQMTVVNYCYIGLGGAGCTANSGYSLITNVTMNTINNSPGCASTANGDYYVIVPSATATTTLYKTYTYSASVTCDASSIVSVWIDYNQNGVFEASEWTQIYTSATTGSATITIPSTALTGQTVMRVRSRNSGSPDGSGDACTNFASGVDADYIVTIAPQPALDAGVSAITTAATCPGSGTITATVTNYGSTTLNSVKVTAAGCSLSPVSLTGLSVPTGGTTTVNLGTYTLVGGANSITAATSAPNGGTDLNTSNDSYTGTLTVGLSGTYTVGATGANFTTLTNAVAAYNAAPICGPVVLQLTSTYNSANEPWAANGPITINANTAASSTNTLTIEPAAGVTATITAPASAATSATIQLNAASYVIINGASGGSGTTQNLTISNANTAGSNEVVLLSNNSGLTAGTTHCTIENCIITGNSSTTTQACIQLAASAGGSQSTIANSNNLIQNNTLSAAYYGIYMYGPTAGEASNIISGNTLSTLGYNGIYAVNELNTTINNNTITGVSTSNGGATEVGIYIGGVTNGTTPLTQIYDNNIGNINNTSTSAGGSYGIYLGSTSTVTAKSILVYNNYIWNCHSTKGNNTGSSLNNGYGIVVASGGGYVIDYNSIYLGTTQPTTSSSAAMFVYAATASASIAVENNIFDNPATTGTVYGVYSLATTAAYSPISNNDYYVGTGTNLGFFNGTACTSTLLITTNSGDPNPINVAPPYTNVTTAPYTLSLPNTASAFRAGLTISSPAITTDIVGTTRASTPTIGAFEIIASGLDAGVSAISAGGTCPGTQPVSVTVANYGTTAITSVTVNCAACSVTSQTFTAGSGGFTSIAAGGSEVVSMGTVTLATGSNPVTASTSAPNGVSPDANPANDSYTSSLNAGLSGTYTVGTGGQYATLTAAVAAYNAAPICGNVVFSLINAAATPYNTTNGETFPIVINTNAGATGSSHYTLTIQPNTGVAPIITGTTTTSIINLASASYVTINGAAGGSGTTQALTISNTNTGTASSVILLSSTASAGSTNNTIENCTITGNSATTTLDGIVSGGATAGSAALSANKNNTYTNNIITKTQNGIYLRGLAGESGNTVSGNTLGTLQLYGIYASTQTGAVISSNTISSISTASAASAGIYVTVSTSSTIASNNISGISMTGAAGTSNVAAISIQGASNTLNVYNNKINNISNAGSGGYSAIGVLLASTSSSTGINVYNNYISNLSGYGFSSGGYGNNPVGIDIYSGTGYNLYFNSIYLANPLTNTAGPVACVYVETGFTPTPASLVIENNIFDNAGESTPVVETAYGIYSAVAKTAFTTIDYNDYVSGTATGGNLGYLGGNTATSLAAMVTDFGGNANSINVVPAFTSASTGVLSLTSGGNTALIAGTPVSSPAITTDIVGTTRNGTKPTIGAFELVALTLDAGVTNITSPGTCAGAATILATVTNFGSTALTSVKITAAGCSLSGTTFTSANTTGVFPLAYGASATISLGTYTLVYGANSITAATSLPNGGTDLNTSNDSYTASISASLGGTYTVGASGANYTNLTNAVAAYNAAPICGPVVFQLTSTYTSATETFPIKVNYNSGASSINTLTIEPYAGTTQTIAAPASAAANATIQLNAAQYVTINGAAGGSGTTPALTISNAYAGGGNAVVFISSDDAVALTGAVGNSIKNCIITGNASTTTSYGVYVGDATLGNQAAYANTGNTIQNNTITAVDGGIYVYGLSGGTESGNSAIGNTMSNMGQLGIYFYEETGATISSNTISAMTTAVAGNGAGIWIDGNTTNTNIYLNKINNIANTNTAGYTAAGIYLGSTSSTASTNVYNNYISNIYGYGDGLIGYDEGPVGIDVNNGGGYNIYYNSVYLGTAITHTASPTAALMIESGATGGLVVEDNIFDNAETTPSSSFYAVYSAYYSGNPFTTLNYNDYVGKTGLLNYINSAGNTVNYTTTAAIATGLGFTDHSKALVPAFTSASTGVLSLTGASTNLRAGIQITSPAITTDIVGTTRSTTTPTMGAFEILPVANDAGVSAITTSTVCPGTGTAVVTVTNYGTNPITQVVVTGTGILASATNSGQTFSASNTGGGSFPIAVGGSTTITLTGITLVGGSNALTAATSLPNGTTDGNSLNDSYTATANVGLTGTYTVGTGGNFTTLAAAAAAYNAAPICGPVVFSLINTGATAYTTTSGETFPISFNNNTGASSTNTLTVQPAAGNTSCTITGSNGNAILKLYGAKYVTINGAAGGTGTAQNLTIVNTYTGSSSFNYSSNVIWVASTGSVGTAYCTVQNCIVTGQASTVSSGFLASGTYGGIFSGGNSTATNANVANSNNTFRNNTISNAQYGIYLMGYSNGTDATNVVVSNTISGCSNAGVEADYQSGTQIDSNTISAVASAYGGASGINISATSIGGLVRSNYISNISCTISTYSAAGIYLAPINSGTGTLISNNMIWAVTGPGTASNGNQPYNGHGILIFQGGGFTIANNTISLSINQPTAAYSAGLFVCSGGTPVPTGLVVENNIFANTETTGSTYGIYSQVASSAFTTIDYNDYYVGTGTKFGYLGGNQANITAIATAFGGNTHSALIQPSFVSATNLNLNNYNNFCLASGTPISGITTDINGNTRVVPVMGADEISFTFGTTTAAAACSGSGVTVTVTAPASTLATGSYTVTYSLTGANTAAGTATLAYTAGSTNSGTFTIPAASVPTAGATTLTITGLQPATACTPVGSSFAAKALTVANVAADQATITIVPTPSGGTIPAASYCSGSGSGSVAVTGASNATQYAWSLPTGLTGSSTTSTITVSGSTPGSYTVTATPQDVASGITCSGTPVTGTVTIVATPSGGTVAAVSYCASTGSATVSVTGVTNVTDYVWSLPSGLTGTSTTSTITVSGATAGTYTVSVTPRDAASGVTCSGTQLTGTVTIVATPSGGSIATVSYCASTGSATVSVTGVTNVTDYVWSLPSGLTGTSTTSTITVSGSTAGSYTVTATPQDVASGVTCTGTPVTGTVTIVATPGGATAANVSICSATGSGTVAVSGGSNATQYAWSLPSGLSLSSGSTTLTTVTTGTSVTVYGSTAGTYTVTVTPQDAASGITCSGTSLTPTVTVYQSPVAMASCNGPLLTGQTINLYGSPSGMATYAWSGPNSFTSALQNPTITNASSANVGIYYLTVTASNGCKSTDTTLLDISQGSYTWTGALSSAWGTPGNWTPQPAGGGPTGCIENVIIPVVTGPAVYPVITTAQSIGSLTIGSGASLTLNANLSVCGNVTAGTSTASTVSGTGQLILNGSSTQAITGSLTVNYVTINNSASGVPVSSSGTLTVNNAFVMTKGNFTNTGTLTLVSNAIGDAYYDDFTSSTAGVFYNSMTVQRYISSAANGYRDLSAPVNGLTVAALNSAYTVSGQNNVDCYYSYNPYPNVQVYYENYYLSAAPTAFDSHWFSYTSLTNQIKPLYGVSFRTDVGSAYTLNFTGPPNTGALSTAVTNTATAAPNNGWNFIGNPYPSPIKWNSVVSLNAGIGIGGYYVFVTTGEYAGGWASYINGQGVGGANGNVPIGQGIFVRPTTSGTFVINNSVRETTTADPYLAPVGLSQVRLVLSGQSNKDEIVAYTDSRAHGIYDPALDAEKMSAGSSVEIGYSQSDTGYAILAVNGFTAQTVLPLSIMVADTGSYSLNPENIYVPGLTAYLLDATDSSYSSLSDGPVSLQLNGYQRYSGRYYIVFEPNSTTGIATVHQSPTRIYSYGNTVYVSRPASSAAIVTVTNVIGQELKSINTHSQQLNFDMPGDQPYYVIVKVTEGEKVTVAKVLIAGK